MKRLFNETGALCATPPQCGTMQADGFSHPERSRLPDDWPELVATAATAVDAALEKTLPGQTGAVLETINSGAPYLI